MLLRSWQTLLLSNYKHCKGLFRHIKRWLQWLQNEKILAWISLDLSHYLVQSVVLIPHQVAQVRAVSGVLCTAIQVPSCYLRRNWHEHAAHLTSYPQFLCLFAAILSLSPIFVNTNGGSWPSHRHHQNIALVPMEDLLSKPLAGSGTKASKGVWPFHGSTGETYIDSCCVDRNLLQHNWRAWSTTAMKSFCSCGQMEIATEPTWIYRTLPRSQREFQTCQGHETCNVTLVTLEHKNRLRPMRSQKAKDSENEMKFMQLHTVHNDVYPMSSFLKQTTRRYQQTGKKPKSNRHFSPFHVHQIQFRGAPLLLPWTILQWNHQNSLVTRSRSPMSTEHRPQA